MVRGLRARATFRSRRSQRLREEKIQKKKAQAITALKDALSNRYILAEIVDLDLFNISDESEFQQAIVEELR